MEQKRVPEPNPMQETISPVFPRRRFGSNATCGAVAPSAFSAAPQTIAAVVVFKNSRRDQRDVMPHSYERERIKYGVFLFQWKERITKLQTVETYFRKRRYFIQQKKGPNLWGLFSVMPRSEMCRLNSGLQSALDGRDTGKLPFIPHLVHHLLDVGEVLFLEVIEAALFGEEFFHRNSSLARLARVPGVNDVPVDDFVERIDAAFDAQLAKLVGVARMIVPTLWTGLVGVD